MFLLAGVIMVTLFGIHEMKIRLFIKAYCLLCHAAQDWLNARTFPFHHFSTCVRFPS